MVLVPVLLPFSPCGTTTVTTLPIREMKNKIERKDKRKEGTGGEGVGEDRGRAEEKEEDTEREPAEQSRKQ